MKKKTFTKNMRNVDPYKKYFLQINGRASFKKIILLKINRSEYLKIYFFKELTEVDFF